jgi:eukaryotic-like serine/threonine-protein kinase
MSTSPRNFGRYRLVEYLGHGGMAEVWKARMIGVAGFKRTVVVKRILPEYARDHEFVEMFLQEARLSARLSHPNIVQVYDLGQADGEYFMAMEYVRGPALLDVIRELLRRGTRLPIGFAVTVVRDVCRALGYAHALVDEEMHPLEIVHRDVSPSNVMLSNDGVVKLLDFGVAKAAGASNNEKTRSGVLKGKFSYMSPEQAEGKPLDHRSDLFASGVILHELLASRRLFKGENDLDTLNRVKTLEVRPPSQYNPDVTAELDAICLRALERDPEKRYQSGDAMANELDRVAAQLQWNTGSLGFLIRELFPTRLAFDPDAPDAELTGSSVEGGDVTIDGKVTRPMADPSPRREVLVLLGAAAAVLLTAALTVLWTHNAPPPARPVLAAGRADEVRITIRSLPSGSQVYIDDELRGATPLQLSFERDANPVRVTIEHFGFATYETTLAPDESQTLHATLSPNAAASPTVAAGGRARHRRLPRPIDLDSPVF